MLYRYRRITCGNISSIRIGKPYRISSRIGSEINMSLSGVIQLLIILINGAVIFRPEDRFLIWIKGVLVYCGILIINSNVICLMQISE